MIRIDRRLAVPCALLAVACSDYTLVGDKRVPPPGDQPTELWPNTVVDEYMQRTAIESDILFIVDDSGSMIEEQENLAANFAEFGQYFFGSDIDFHMGVIRGDLSGSNPDAWGALTGGLNPPYVDQDTPNGEQSMVTIVENLGDSGSGVCESGTETAAIALTEPMLSGFNAGFYRENAMLMVVVITDEDDRATDGSCDMTTQSGYSWAQWFLGLKQKPDLVNLGIIAGFSPQDNVTPESCTSSFGDAEMADAYAVVAENVPNSTTWSVCSSDWTPMLNEIGIAAAGLTREFTLSRIPSWDWEDWDEDGNTNEPMLEVWVDRQDGAGWVKLEPLWSAQPDPRNPWDYNQVKNTVVFTVQTMPEEGWKLQAIYPNSEEG